MLTAQNGGTAGDAGGKRGVMYTVTITKTETVRKTIPKRWEKIGQEEVAREEQFWTKDAKTRISDVMGYTPETDTMVEETTEVLKQSVEKMDLVEVIKAINGI